MALEKYSSAFKIKEYDAVDLYNAACNAALSGQSKIAMELLNKSVDNGYFDEEHLKKDCDLYSLHSLKDWEVLFSKIEREKSNVKTEEEVFKKVFISDSISKNLYELFFTKDYKSKNTKQDFEKDRSLLSNLVKANKIESTKDLGISDFSQSMKYDSIRNSRYRCSFIIAPSVFGVNINEYLMTRAGYRIAIEYSTTKGNALINELKIEKQNLLSPSINIKQRFETFITTIDTCHFRFGIFNNDKRVIGISSTTSIKNKIKKIFEDLEYAESTELPKLDASKKHGYISFFTGDSETSGPKNSIGFVMQQTFEFIFFDNTDIIVVSTNGEYGFYRTKKIEKIKDFISNRKNTLI
ncbi:hypothetical protein [Flavobacterium procerum]|uniref:hypothetical protein n=1 Tax=Flavobacterium procerum TaxID=1455569 RepID=UPI0036D3233A